MQWRLCRLGDLWAVRIEGSRYRTRVRFAPDTKAEARAQAEIIARQHRTQYGAALTTCDEIMAAYIEDAQLRENPVTSPDSLRYARKAVAAHYGRLTPADCTREQCREYIKAGRAAGRADSTMRTQLSYLRASLFWHDRNTPAVFELPAEQKTRDRWLDQDEIQALINGAQSPHIRLFIITALCTAARTEAILGLTWETHIDLAREEVWLGFKVGGKGRATLPMNSLLKAALKDAQELAISPYVIEHNGSAVGSVRKGLKNAYARAGITDIRQPAHIIRKTAGRLLAESGVDMPLISQIMGHSSEKVTRDIYARFSPDGMRASLENIRL